MTVLKSANRTRPATSSTFCKALCRSDSIYQTSRVRQTVCQTDKHVFVCSVHHLLSHVSPVTVQMVINYNIVEFILSCLYK